MATAPPPPPPPGLTYLAAVSPLLTGVLIGHTFTVIELLLLVTLFYFSSSATRRKGVFFLNVLTLSLAIAVGALADYRSITAILSPAHNLPVSLNIAIGVLGIVQYILVDTTLLLRLTSIYPRTLVGTNLVVLICAFPVLLKVLRSANLIAFIVVLVQAANSPNPAAQFAVIWSEKPYLKIEWVAQAIDNAYASILFLTSLWRRRKAHWNSGATFQGRSSLAQRLKVIFWFATYSFALPFLFSIAQLVIVFLPTGTVDAATVNDIVLVNTSVAVVGVVFATFWAESETWIEARKQDATVVERNGLSGGDLKLGSSKLTLGPRFTRSVEYDYPMMADNSTSFPPIGSESTLPIDKV